MTSNHCSTASQRTACGKINVKKKYVKTNQYIFEGGLEQVQAMKGRPSADMFPQGGSKPPIQCTSYKNQEVGEEKQGKQLDKRGKNKRKPVSKEK